MTANTAAPAAKPEFVELKAALSFDLPINFQLTPAQINSILTILNWDPEDGTPVEAVNTWLQEHVADVISEEVIGGMNLSQYIDVDGIEVWVDQDVQTSFDEGTSEHDLHSFFRKRLGQG